MSDPERFFAPPSRDQRVFDEARTASLRALRMEPVPPSWRRQAGVVTAVGFGITCVGAWTTAHFGGVAPGLLGARLPAVGLLLAVQLAALWSAIAPRSSRLWKLAWAGTALGVGLLLHERAIAGVPPLSPHAAGWICSASHIGVGVVPAVVMLGFLRRISWSLPRALTAGLAVGVSGLVWGEIACERPLGHVLIHHVGAMVLLTLTCAALAHRLARGSYAP